MQNKIRTWEAFFKTLETKDYFKSLNEFLDKEYKEHTVFPPRHLLYNAFRLTPLENVKVVIIGQDPYHEVNQSMGLAFSVQSGIKNPPSLMNIKKEISNEYGCVFDDDGDLTYLAEQGVLLLNAILSVRESEPLSHNIKEYKLLLSDVLKVLNEQEHPIVFLLWGGFARSLKKAITNKNHLILEANHPSPLSANRGGWFGCNHFKLVNEFLIKNGLNIICWEKPSLLDYKD